MCLVFSRCGKGGGSTPQPVDPPVITTPSITITDFSPKSGSAKTKITITGTGFGSDVAKVRVAIGNSGFNTPISVTPTSIVFESTLTATTGKIKVLINDNTYTSTSDFTALAEPLRILSFSNAAGQFGNGQLGYQMYINTSSIAANIDTNKIFISFNGTKAVKANYIGGGRVSVGAIVPRYALAGKVTLTVDGQVAVSDEDYNFDMSMRDFTPKSVTTGDTVKITGVEFGTVDDMSVEFNSATTLAKPYKVTKTEMWVVVPSDAKSGYLTVKQRLGLSNISDAKFTFTPRVFFSNYALPSSAKVNDVIAINGDFTGADISTIGVSFGGSAPVKPTSISGPNISVKIPADAKTGKITISRTGYTPFTSAFAFTISK